MLGDVDGSLVALEDVSFEFFYLLEVNSSFSAFEGVADDGLLEIEGGVVVLRGEGDGGCLVVVERGEEWVLAGIVGFPFFEVVKD